MQESMQEVTKIASLVKMAEYLPSVSCHFPANTQRRYNVAATSRRCSYVVATLCFAGFNLKIVAYLEHNLRIRPLSR